MPHSSHYSKTIMNSSGLRVFFSKAKGVIEIIARDEKLKTKVVKMMNNSICKPHHKIGHS